MAFLQKSLKSWETMLIVFLFLLLGYASFYAGLHASAMAEWSNNDLGWSMRNGWQDVHHWQIGNTYTWLGEGNRLTHSEWLFDVLLYGISLIPNGLAWLWRIMYLALFVVSFVLFWQKQERKIESYHFDLDPMSRTL